MEAQKGSIRFIPTTCPACNGELRVPEDKESVLCMYCGASVIVQKKDEVTTKNTIDRLMTLAFTAQEARNYQDAYKYFSQILEQDTEIPEAWIRKGVSAGWLSTIDNPRLKEAIVCIQKGIELNPSQNDNRVYAAENLARIVFSYTANILENIVGRTAGRTQNPTPGATVLIDPVSAGLISSAVSAANRSDNVKRASSYFQQYYQEDIIQALELSWHLDSGKNVGILIINTTNLIMSSDLLSNMVTSSYTRHIQSVIDDIKRKHPDLQHLQHTKRPNPNKTDFSFVISGVILFLMISYTIGFVFSFISSFMDLLSGEFSLLDWGLLLLQLVATIGFALLWLFISWKRKLPRSRSSAEPASILEKGVQKLIKSLTKNRVDITQLKPETYNVIILEICLFEVMIYMARIMISNNLQ